MKGHQTGLNVLERDAKPQQRFRFSSQTDQRPRRERVQLQEVRQGPSQAAQAESALVHPGGPAAGLLQVGDVTWCTVNRANRANSYLSATFNGFVSGVNLTCSNRRKHFNPSFPVNFCLIPVNDNKLYSCSTIHTSYGRCLTVGSWTPPCKICQCSSPCLHSGFTTRCVPPATSSLRGCFEEDAQSTSVRPPIRRSSSFWPSTIPPCRWENATAGFILGGLSADRAGGEKCCGFSSQCVLFLRVAAGGEAAAVQRSCGRLRGPDGSGE